MNSLGGKTTETTYGTLFIGHNYALQPNNRAKIRQKVQKLGSEI